MIESIINGLTWMYNNPTLILQIALQVIGVASIIVKATPTKVDDKYLNKIIKVFQMFSLYKENKVVISTKKK